MSTVIDPSQATTDAAGSGAGSGQDAGIIRAEDPGGQFSPLAEPFAGWMCLADCASDIAPGIGDVMRSAGLLARAAIEAQAPDLSRELTEVLAGPRDEWAYVKADEAERLARPVVAATVHQMLEAGRLPLSVPVAARNLADSVRELDADERGLLGELGGVAASEFPAITSLTSAGGYRDLTGQMLLSAGSRLASEAAGVAPPRPGTDPDGFFFAKAGARWWLTASLELPDSMSGQHPVHCVRPEHRMAGDRIQITESTYQNLDVDDALLCRGVRAGEISSGYRGTLRDDEADMFADVVTAPMDYRSYVCRALIEPDSRAVRSVSRIVASHRQQISGLVDSAAQVAVAAISAAHPAAVLAAPLVQLLANLVGPITEHLVSALAQRTGPRSLPAWLISHTVVWANASTPLSVFLLRCPDEEVRRMRLHGIRAATGSGQTQISADYRDLPKVLYNHGRLMWGASRPDPALAGMPADLWSVVDGQGRPGGHGEPVIWTQPEFDSRGFRVLVPQQGGNARYVTALRADIRFT